MSDTKRHQEIPWMLIIDRLQGCCGEEKTGTLDAWLHADHRHQALWEEIQRAWAEIMRENSAFEPDREKAWRMVEGRLAIGSAGGMKRKTLWYVRVAAAAVLPAVGIFAGMYLKSSPDPMDTPAAKVTYTDYQTQSGKSLVSLPDGSRVWLNAHSALRFPSNFGSAERQVTVSGEAFFDVAHDPDLSFTVQLNDLNVKVHGTRFNVREYGNGDAEVTLLNGSVSLFAVRQSEILLEPGYTATYSHERHTVNVAPADTLTAALWAGNKLVIEDQPLEKVVQILQIWFGKKIEIDPKLRTTSFYRLTVRDESFEEILQLMQKTGNFKYKPERNKVIIY
ncbi:MAG: FecR domain-containing protein [Bacteroidales bacterium]|jgi:ferric-dicitrate binding protein FerR (iron transport regulator)|nr:FecR domain-containing protein [Bacteroidales bacterium]